MFFLEIDSPLRTNQSFREQTQDEHHVGVFPLVQLDVDMLEDFQPEPMHLLYLGVQRLMFRILLKGPLAVRLRGRTKEIESVRSDG